MCPLRRATTSSTADAGPRPDRARRADSIEVVLYGEEDAQVLRRNKFPYTVRIADLERRNEANRRADRRYSARVAQTGSQLPSGRTTYRRLPDYELDLKLLAERYPGLVKPIVLPHRSHLGRDVLGIEIATDPYNIRDGKPTFLNMGVHHAREWPSSEHAIEWAYDLGSEARRRRSTGPRRPGSSRARTRPRDARCRRRRGER